MSAAYNGPIVAALVGLEMEKYFAGSIIGIWPSGDLGVVLAASAAASPAVFPVAVAAGAVQAAAAVAFLPAAAVHDVAAFVVAVAAAVHAAVHGLAAFVAAVVAVVVVAVAVRVAAAVVAAVRFGFVAVLVVHSVPVVWVGIDVAAVVVLPWASCIVAADTAFGEEVNSVAIAVEAAGNEEQVGHPLDADPVTAVVVGPLQMGKHCCTA